MVRWLGWVGGLAIALCGASVVLGDTITVTTCADNESDGCGIGECTLREAIGGAVAGDVIDFAVPLADCADGEIDLGSPGLTITIDLTIEGPGAEFLAVDGNGRRVFDVGAGVIVVIEGLTVKGGRTSSASQHGAGIRNAGDLTLRGVVVTGNQAFGSSLDDFQHGASGGGIHNRATGTLIVENSVVTGNAAGRGSGPNGLTHFHPGDGGGIFSFGDLTVTESTVSGNVAGNSFSSQELGGHGGGIYLGGGVASIDHSTISGNRSGDGAPSFGGSLPSGLDGFGGGIHGASSAVVIVWNSTISGNGTGSTATGLPGDGGGLYLTGSSVASLGNVTITNNHADRDGGGILRASSAAVTIGNSILAGNTAGNGNTRDCGGLGSGSSAGFNVIGVGNACSSAFGGDDQVGSSASTLDAKLDPLGTNGGPTATHLPQAGSPAVDAGDPAGCTYFDPVLDVDVPVLDDQRLISRPLDGDYDGEAVCDSGSVEVVPEDFTVSVTLVGPGSVVSDPAGIDCEPTCESDFAGGTNLQLTATADPGHLFTGWSDSCAGANNPCELVVDDEEFVTATFVVAHELTVDVDGSGTGSVTGPGIDCPGDCGESIADGAEITLVATEEPGSAFTGWSGACSGTGECHLTVTEDVSVTATFADLVKVSVTKDGTGGGTVTSLDGGIDCGLDCEEEYPSGTAVELSAAADAGSVFSGWSSGCSGAGGCSLAPVADVSVTATFLPLVILTDGFESGTFDAWSARVP